MSTNIRYLGATPPTPTTNIGMDSHRYHQEHLTPHRRNSRNSRRTMKQDKLYDSDTDLSCEETVNGVCNMLSPRNCYPKPKSNRRSEGYISQSLRKAAPGTCNRNDEISDLTQDTPHPINIAPVADKQTYTSQNYKMSHSIANHALCNVDHSKMINTSKQGRSECESPYKVGYSGNSTELTACSAPATGSGNELSIQTQSHLIYYGEVLNTLIIAPNVNRLPMESIVQIHLKSMTSDTEATVLCSIDVLRMKSIYFQHILESALNNPLPKESVHAVVKDPLSICNVRNIHSAVTDHVLNNTTAAQSKAPHTLIIDLREEFPLDAAALLESLHDGRTLFKGEWNACWARLSVTWEIQDLMKEYSSIIDQHVNKLLSTIRKYHWRTNSNNLNGFRIASFRKSSSETPTIIQGTCVAQGINANLGILRVEYDQLVHTDTTEIEACSNVISQDAGELYVESNARVGKASTPIRQLTPKSAMVSLTSIGTPKVDSTHQFIVNQTYIDTPRPLIGESAPQYIRTAQTFQKQHSPSTPQNQNQVKKIGEVSETFWIKKPNEWNSAHTVKSMWHNPDEYFILEVIKQYMTIEDIDQLWDMLTILIQYPIIADLCESEEIKTHHEIGIMLSKPENKVLWIHGDSSILPKGVVNVLLDRLCVLKSHSLGSVLEHM